MNRGLRLALSGLTLMAPLATSLTARAQQLPPSLPLTQAFGAPVEQGGAAPEAVVLTLPIAALWHHGEADVGKAAAARHRAQLAAMSVDTGLRTRWAIGANVEVAAPHARTGTAGLTAPLVDSSGALTGRPRLSGDDGFVLMQGQRTPARTLGMDLSYGLTDRSGRGLSIGSSVGMASYASETARRVPIGTTHIKLTF